MNSAPFSYHAPRNLADACTVLAGEPDGSVVLGGGTMLVPEMTHGRVTPRTLIDLSRAGLSGIRGGSGEVVIGAMTTYADILSSPAARTAAPLVAQVAAGITGGPQIRGRGTIGGSASYANPASDIPTCLVAAGARIRLASAAGVREMAADQFYLGPFRTARRADEILAEVVVPAPAGARWGYMKLKTCESSWPIVTAGCLLRGDGTMRVALGGASSSPVLVSATPPPAEGGPGDRGWREQVRAAVDSALADPWADVLADSEYRRRVAPAIVSRAVARALAQESEAPAA